MVCVSLIIQCISAWDFSPVSSKASVFINNVNFPYVAKNGGYFVITKPLPSIFTLKIIADGFHTFEYEISEIPQNKIVLVELLVSKTPLNAKLVEVNPPATIVLGYDYYRVTEIGENYIVIDNPKHENIEGRRFLLRDTQSKAEEFVIMGDMSNVGMTKYTIPNLKHDYNVVSTGVLSAFRVENNINQISIREEKFWVYKD